MDIRRQVGLNVQRLRRALELSQEELAFEAAIHRTYISGVERGVRNMTVTVVARLATALKVEPHELLLPLPKGAPRATKSAEGQGEAEAVRKAASAVPRGPESRSGTRKHP
jgi:transcriptional regulator with XRE-family HTH domain